MCSHVERVLMQNVLSSVSSLLLNLIAYDGCSISFFCSSKVSSSISSKVSSSSKVRLFLINLIFCSSKVSSSISSKVSSSSSKVRLFLMVVQSHFLCWLFGFIFYVGCSVCVLCRGPFIT